MNELSNVEQQARIARDQKLKVIRDEQRLAELINSGMPLEQIIAEVDLPLRLVVGVYHQVQMRRELTR